MSPFQTDSAVFISHLRSLAGRALVADPAFTLARENNLSVQWIPSDHVPRSARLAIVGITPGREQAQNCLDAFTRAVAADLPLDVAMRYARLHGSFSGPIRSNLVRMLDVLGLHTVFNITSCAVLFEAQHEKVHFTSALRFPVFVDGANYNGKPDLLRHPLLRAMCETFLAAEIRLLPNALWLPLGPKPTAALRHLVSLGVLSTNRVLEGLPHPSGANSERVHFFLGLKDRAALSRKTRPDQIESAREKLITQVCRLSSA